MDTSTTEQSAVETVDQRLERLIAYEPSVFPVISIYLNLEPNHHGRDEYERFLHKELTEEAKEFEPGSVERESFDEDVEKIWEFLENELDPAANGLALFACSAAGLFETIQLNAPVEEHRLYVYNQPHLYHLVRLTDEYPRYAAVLSNSNQARVYVFGLGQVLAAEDIKGDKTNRVKVGGWSQARYRRRLENAHYSHAKEVAEVLERIVREEEVKSIVLSGDKQFLAKVEEELPKHLLERVIDSVKLEHTASDQEVWEATLARMREEDAATDAEKVERLLAEYRSKGLACAGFKRTLEALAKGQVDELLISTSFEEKYSREELVDPALAPEIPDADGETESGERRRASLPDLLVTKAKQTDAAVTFIQDAELMEPLRGVGAFLRWR